MKIAEGKRKIKSNRMQEEISSQEDSKKIDFFGNDNDSLNENALEEYFKNRIDEIENELAELYEKKIDEITIEYEAQILTYKNKIKELESFNSKLIFEATKLTDSKHLNPAGLELNSENSRIEDEHQDINTEENEDVIFRKGLDDSLIHKKEIFSQIDAHQKIIPYKNEQKKNRRTEKTLIKDVQQDTYALESQINMLKTELKAKDSEIGRLKSSFNIKLKSFQDSKREMEIQIDNERQSFEQKIRILDNERSQFLEIQKRLIYENNNLKTNPFKFDKIEAKLLENHNNELQINKKATQNSVALKEKINVIENKQLTATLRFKKGQIEKEFMGMEATTSNKILLIPSEVVKINSDIEKPDDSIINITEMMQASKKIESKNEDNVILKPKEDIGSDIHKLITSQDSKTQININIAKILEHTENNQSNDRKIEWKLNQISDKIVEKDFLNNSIQITKIFSTLFFSDSEIEMQRKLHKNKVEILMSKDDDLVNEYLKKQFSFINVHLPEFVMLRMKDINTQVETIACLKSNFKSIADIWRETNVSYSERIHRLAQWLEATNLNSLKFTLDNYQKQLNKQLNDFKDLYNLIQKRERLKNSICKTGNDLKDFYLFYKNTFHDWKRLLKISNQIAKKADIASINVLYKGIPLKFLTEIDTFEIEYLQKMKIRLDIKSKVTKMHH